MITITVDNSYSKIEGLTPAQEQGLRRELSYVVGGSSAYFSGYGPRRKSLLSKKNEFPTGLLGRVKAFVRDYTVRDIRIRPCKIAKIVD